MRSLKTVFYVGIVAGVASLNVLTYRILQEQRFASAQVLVLSVQGVMANANQALARMEQLQQATAHDEQGN